MVFLNILAAVAITAQAQITPDPFTIMDSDIQQRQRTLQGADTADVAEGDVPTFVSLGESLRDFKRFANGGPDSNWYIGFNNAWIVKLPPAPEADFKRAFIGAKIGRAKTRPRRGRRRERQAIPGKIYMAISPRPAFSSSGSYFLTETGDIPREVNEKMDIEGTGEARWFWKEVPLGRISTTEPNYLIIWSPTRTFKDAKTAPILAAAQSRQGEEQRAWINNQLQGVAPRSTSRTLQVPISLKPALAIKLVPEPGGEVVVSDLSTRPSEKDVIVEFSTEGKNLAAAWVEISTDELAWRRITREQRVPPFAFRVSRELIPTKGAYIRGAARDILAVEGRSDNMFLPGEGGL
jgi:hypothetical protein